MDDEELDMDELDLTSQETAGPDDESDDGWE